MSRYNYIRAFWDALDNMRYREAIEVSQAILDAAVEAGWSMTDDIGDNLTSDDLASLLTSMAEAAEEVDDD